MEHLPIFLDIKNRKVIVDGGETIAARRVERALDAGANVSIFAETLSPEFEKMRTHESLTHYTRAPIQPDFVSAVVAYGTTEDPERDQALYDMANDAGVLVNIADNTKYCDFITPSIIDRSPIVIAVSSGGEAPIIARILRARIEAMLPAAYGRLAAFVGGLRHLVMERISNPTERRRFWENAIDGSVSDLFLADNQKAAEDRFHANLDAAANGEEIQRLGEVYLVGAGPGDPDLLTFRALHLMQRADVVLYDRLIGDGIINLVRRDAERIYVGKKPKQHRMKQQEISDLMVKLALEGKKVLRLKGGDPFIFGRGGEELETLAAANVPFQVIPGITAASGCASYAGIPLTHRDHAQSCVFVTAHGRDGVLSLDWDTLVKPNQTVVVYMGRSSLGFLTTEFIKNGVSSDTPVAIVDNGTRSNQRVVTGTLSDIHARAEAAELEGPALVIIGSVVVLNKELSWFRKDLQQSHAMTLSARPDL